MTDKEILQTVGGVLLIIVGTAAAFLAIQAVFWAIACVAYIPFALFQ